jgi:hypothetical protein
MKKPTLVYQFVLSIVLAGCTKAEFVKITDSDGSAGSRGDATPTLQCEDKSSTLCVQPAPNTANSVPCPDLCHTTAGQPAGTEVACQSFNAYDNCGAGNACLAIDNGNTTHICFKLCTDATQCGGVACAARFMSKDTWINVCDLQYTSCSAIGGCCDPLTPLSGKCGNGRVCYLVAPLKDSPDSRTVCEYASGDGKGDSCGSSRDCVPGYACHFLPTSPERGTCMQVCNMQDPKRCPTCTAYNNQYGVCS